MAKKTKSQKIIAELRRKIKASQSMGSLVFEKKTKNLPQGSLEISPQEKKPVVFDKKDSSLSVSEKAKSSAFFYDFNPIKKDLLKTFFLTVIAVFFELMLYWSFEINKNQFIQNILLKKLF